MKCTRAVAICLLGLLVASLSHAQSNIAELIEQTGISAGNSAMRDMPGWRVPKKIIVLDAYGAAAALDAVNSGARIVAVADEAAAIAEAADADAVIGFCTEDVVSAAPQASWIQVYSAGAEDCMATTRIVSGQVVLTNGQKLSSPVIAEHAIAMLLALARRLPQFVQAMQDGNWSRGSEFTSRMESVAGKTVLVAGLGGIGTEVARRAAALGMRVIGTRRSSRVGPAFVDYVGLPEEMTELAGQADFIVSALPLTPATTAIFDADFFAAAKDGAIFINVSRGQSVVTADLVSALQSGKLAGAGLDVTEPEPLPDGHPLWRIANVIVTPHVSSRGADRRIRMLLLQENLRRFAAGDALLNVVDPQLGY